MVQLNLLDYRDKLRFEKRNGTPHLWDPIRKKWLVSQPEELVRQLTIIYLTDTLHYPIKLIQVEKQLEINQVKHRYDILVYDRDMRPYLLIECKAPQIAVNQHVFDQIARYNYGLSVPYLFVSNGLNHYCCSMNYEEKNYTFLDHVPGPDFS